MIKLFEKKPCKEAECIMKYVDERLDGKQTSEPKVKYPLHTKLLNQYNKLLSNQEIMSFSAKELMDINASISDFDVDMSHISYQLIDFAKEMAILSESNLSVVEEITASMNEVNSTIKDTSGTLQQLSSDSKELIEQNHKSIDEIEGINQLKQEVMNDANIMSIQIEQLVEMANKVNDIVAGVGQIADQTNLLALNASIEAARAGENGRGFAVVAEEIRKLADNTKESLSGMQKFVNNIQNTAKAGSESMNNTLRSTEKMSEKIDVITDTTKNNLQMLESTVSKVYIINEAMKGISDSAAEINQAMDTSTQDAERLTVMTNDIHADALKSSDYAKKISNIDSLLSEIIDKMMGGLEGTVNSISNEDFLSFIKKSEEMHKIWLENLKQIVNEMRIYPIQTNSSKCAFGHFYKSIKVRHPSIINEWKNIESIHIEFHNLGNKVLEAVKSNNKIEAQEYYDSAEKLSKEIFDLFNKINLEVEKHIEKNIHMF